MELLETKLPWEDLGALVKSKKVREKPCNDGFAEEKE